MKLNFDLNEDIAAPYIATGAKPQMAILREQGVNSHLEMAAAFNRAGFAAVDVHMSDILEGRLTLEQFKGLVACGGFSYGDYLRAGAIARFSPVMNAVEEFANAGGLNVWMFIFILKFTLWDCYNKVGITEQSTDRHVLGWSVGSSYLKHTHTPLTGR